MLLSVVLLGLLTSTAHSQFARVLDIPGTSPNIGDNASIYAGTQLNLSEGGSIGYNFDAYSVVNISGGNVGFRFSAFDGSKVTISGGDIGYLIAYDGSEVNITGGNFDDGIRAFIGSTVNIAGGYIGGKSLRASRDSTVNISGGTISPRFYGQGGEINISGGNFSGGFTAVVDTIVNLSGGTFGEGNFLVPSTTLHLYGSKFLLDGLPIEGPELGKAFTLPYGHSTLSGLLADGSPFQFDLNAILQGDGFVVNSETVTLMLAVPEPSTCLPLLLAMASVVGFRKRFS